MEGYGFMKVNVVGLQKLIQLMDNFLIINNTNRNYNYTNVLNNKESEIIKKIAIEDIDFSGQTIVLGKDGILSSTIIDSTASRLLNLGINVYVSDIDKLTIDIASIIPTIPNIVCIILCLTLCFWSTSTTAYRIKPIISATPDKAIPTLKAQFENVCIALIIESTL